MITGVFVFIGLSGLTIGMLFVAKEVIEQMTRRNDLLEADLRSKGVNLDKAIADSATRAAADK
ncbi:hypothetical protein D3C85_1874260 [compost metagenome]